MLLVVLTVMAVLMALSALGVEVGPLIAGAGVVGVAIGFGSQTLVKDVISGVFFLLDDAFRVGEYIESGSIRGTVEGFSLRSIKLRHHRGYLHTVPFGSLDKITNYSRDWVIDKVTLGADLRHRPRQGEADHQADRQGAAGRSRAGAEHHRHAEDAGCRGVWRLRDQDPAEAHLQARRAVRRSAVAPTA